MKIADKTHAKLTTYAQKQETYSDAVERLFSEEPYATELKEEIEKAIEKVEHGKKRGHLDITTCDDLIVAVQKFLAHVAERQRVETP